jgi:hypothetical protein
MGTALLGALTVPAFSEPAFDSLKFSAVGGIEMGQIIRGYYGAERLDHKWQQRMLAHIDFSTLLLDKFHFNFAFEGHYQYSSTENVLNSGTLTPAIGFWMHRLDIDYDVLKGNIPLRVQFGFFPFKYNSAATNLGEYMFRTGCYPNFIINHFDFPMARIMGLNIENHIYDVFHQNLILANEWEIYPTQDFSLAYLASLTFLNRAIEIGGGIDGHRIFSVDPKRTTPHNRRTISKIENSEPVVDEFGDTSEVGDTTYFSFAGTKLMGRITLDPKRLLSTDIFGEEDLKIYAEAAILGTRNYPIYEDSTVRYDILTERMPIMAGVHIPTFKLLDVLAFEMEYYPSRYLNNFSQEANTPLLPLPYTARTDGADTTQAHRVKWSIYAKKTFGAKLQIVAQAARDHRRAPCNSYDLRFVDFGDNTVKKDEWYYLIKVVYGF